MFNNFMNEEEITALKDGGAGEGFSLSLDAGKRLPSGKFEEIRSQARTSETAWCVTDNCTKNVHIEKITARIADVSGIPYANSEYLQVLHYDVGQVCARLQIFSQPTFVFEVI
jgi:hypothetical protein